jgi:hypothetical protein
MYFVVICKPQQASKVIAGEFSGIVRTPVKALYRGHDD